MRKHLPTLYPFAIEVNKPKAFKSHYELLLESELIGEVHFIGFSGHKIEASLLNEVWKFEQKGFWKPLLEFKAEQSPYDKGKVSMGMHSKLQWKSPAGNNYTLKKEKWWKSCVHWYNDREEQVVSFKQNYSFKKKAVEITVHKSAGADLHLLLLLGWTIFKIQTKTAAAVGASA